MTVNVGDAVVFRRHVAIVYGTIHIVVSVDDDVQTNIVNVTLLDADGRQREMAFFIDRIHEMLETI